MDTFTLIRTWWSGQGSLTLGLGLLWLALWPLAGRFAPAELPRLRQTLWLLLLHLAAGLWAAVPGAPDAEPGRQVALLFARLLAVAVAVGLFNHLVLGIGLGRFQRSVPTLLRDVLSLIALLVAAFVLLARHGFDLKALLPTGAVLTAVIGLAMQQTLGNLIGGMAIQLDKSVRVGDWISVEGHYGRVSQIRWRYTSIETNDWETVIVPNSQLLAAKVLVRGRREAREAPWRRWIRFRLPYAAPPAEVLALAEAALAEATPAGVASRPAPQAVLLSLEDGIAHYALRYWLQAFEHDDKVDSEVRLRLFYALRRAGFEPALPAQQVTLVEGGREAREQAAAAEQAGREQALAGMELFGHLSPAELARLARELKPVPFGPGEALCRQGEAADSLYILSRGWVRVEVEGAEGGRELARLGPGAYFGEMGLMTGEPRSATVRAEGHVDALRLDKAAFQALLHERPELAETVAGVLAHRKAELEAARESLDQAARARRQQEHQRQLLGRIRGFFQHRREPRP